MANEIANDLRADDEVLAHPEAYYNEFITINLDELTPYINGPFTPDAARSISLMPQTVTNEGYPEKVDVCLIGSCTNSSYQDMARAASVVKFYREHGYELKAQLIVCPGSNWFMPQRSVTAFYKSSRKRGYDYDQRLWPLHWSMEKNY